MPKCMPRTEIMEASKKEGSMSLQYPMLMKSNYSAWAMKMKVFMQAQGVWDAIEPMNAKAAAEERKDKMAMAAIYQGIPEETLLLLAKKKTAKEAWEFLKTMHLGADRVKIAKVQTLKTVFEALRMKESESIDELALKMSAIVSKIITLGEKWKRHML